MRIPTICASLALFAGANAANCRDVPPWQPRFAYTKGDDVVFQWRLYTAKEWNWNEVPPTHPDIWKDDGPCTWSVHDLVNCEGVPAWSPFIPYPRGSEVVYQGELWVAVQWTEGNAPGDGSGSWENLGPCFN